VLPRQLLGAAIKGGECAGDEDVETTGGLIIGRCLKLKQPPKVVLMHEACAVGADKVAVA
jgi:hypothetical protein